MPRFRIFFEGESLSHHYFAATPNAARDRAKAEDGRRIRKVKVDRETVDPPLRSPRLTRRELQGEPHVDCQ